jgi:hypothetical protein
MGRAKVMCGLLVAASAICACATLLGIDDGKPRELDSSIADASAAETTPDVVVVDVGVDVPVSPLVCGTSTCNAFVEGCCRTSDPSDASAYAFDCVSDAASCKGGLVVTCDESANCTALGHAGTECCAVVPDGGSVATSTQCLPYLDCFGAFMCQPGDDEVCDPDAGQSCLPSVSTILGYTICKT